MASVSNVWQEPPLRSILPVVVNVSAKIAVISNKPPFFRAPLPSYQLTTGQSASLSVPVISAVDGEGDGITAKVIPPSVSFIRWDSSTESLVIDGPDALAAKASGSYQYEVKLTDSKGAHASYTASVEFAMPAT